MASWFRFRQFLAAKSIFTTTTTYTTYCMASQQLVIEKDDELEEEQKMEFQQKDRGLRVNLKMSVKREDKLDGLKEELQQIKGQQSKLLAHLEKKNTAKCYAATLPAPDSNREIHLKNGHKYRAGIEEFIRHGGAHCRLFSIWHDNSNGGFVGYPDNFFDELIKYCYETDKPEEMIGFLQFGLPIHKPASWPSPLIQLLGVDLGLVSEVQLKATNCVPQITALKEEKVEYGNAEDTAAGCAQPELAKITLRNRKLVHYTLRNKHKPEVAFQLRIYFEHGARCYKQMTLFVIERKVME